MKILVICQYYYPEPFRITNICEELVKKGHDVTVVTGTPNYPMGEIYSEYRNKSRQDEIINGVTVHRCPTHPRKTGTLHRLWNYYSYSFSSKRYIKRLDNSFDVVFVNQLSPIMMAKAGIKYAKQYNKKVVLYCLDLWPESLCAGGVRRNSIIYKYFHRVSKKTYTQADKIFITSRSFDDYFGNEFGITDTEYLPQSAESFFLPEECRKKPDGRIDLMFAGNIGAAQSIETIIAAAKSTADIPRLRWHIVGDGSELEKAKMAAVGMKNVIFHDRKPPEEMPQYYAMADAMLVTMQKKPVLSLTLPGKVQTYMAAGKPIIGAIDGETAQVIAEAGCGLCGGAENVQALAENVRRFIDMDRASMGENAKKYYDEHFSKQMFMDKLENELLAVKES